MKLAYAWAGGAAFVLSLGYFLYFYLARLGDPSRLAPATSTGAAVAIDIGLFTLFALHHSVLARAEVKRRLTRWVPPELERSTYTWIASLLLLLTCAAWRRVPGMLYSIEGWAAWLLYAVQAVGIAITAKATAAVDALDLAGIRQVQRADDRQPTALPRLQMSGVYGLVRHPIYLGWALFVFGAPHMTAGRLLFACLSTAYLTVAIRWEERSLASIFGDQYREYQRRVRWRMFPGVY